MEKNLTLDGKTARKIYPGSAPELKTILEKTFSKEFFSQSVKNRINSWEDIAAEYGIDPVNSLPYPNPCLETGYPVFTYEDGTKSNPVADKKHKNACFMLELLGRLLNGKPVNYDNSNQGKYWPWFKKRPAGFGFGDVNTGYDVTHTTVGPRLSFLNAADIKWLVNHPTLSQIYNNYLAQ